MKRLIDYHGIEKMHRKTIYLASPYGFSAHWRERLLKDFILELEGLGLEVWEPFARNSQIDFSINGSAYKVAKADIKDVTEDWKKEFGLTSWKGKPVKGRLETPEEILKANLYQQ